MPKKDFPDHHDAEIVLKLYDLRRESVLRESRNNINASFLPKSFDEIQAVLKPGHPLNAAFRQCSTYWEMTYAMARHGIVNPDFLVESNGEGLLLFSRIEPWLTEYRKDISAIGFRNAEWVATECDMGRMVAARFRARTRAMLDAAK